MATNKDFTMKQYNGTDYDVLYPKNTSQQTLLNDSTLATALGLTATNPEIDQALTEIVSKIATLEDGAVKIQTGSYVGTGTFGASNPCSLTFDFVPKIVVIYKYQDVYINGISGNRLGLFGDYYQIEFSLSPDQPSEPTYTKPEGGPVPIIQSSTCKFGYIEFGDSNSVSSLTGAPTWSNNNKTVSWSGSTAERQLNNINVYSGISVGNYIGYNRYYWVAIG